MIENTQKEKNSYQLKPYAMIRRATVLMSARWNSSFFCVTDN